MTVSCDRQQFKALYRMIRQGHAGAEPNTLRAWGFFASKTPGGTWNFVRETNAQLRGTLIMLIVQPTGGKHIRRKTVECLRQVTVKPVLP